MAVIFERYNPQKGEFVRIGVLIDNEIIGEETIPARSLNLEAEGIEDHMLETYNGRGLNAIKVDDDKVDIDEFRT